MGKKWLSGLLKHSAAINAILCPTVNCHSRLVSNAFAPTKVCWGMDNRTSLIRVKGNEKEA